MKNCSKCRLTLELSSFYSEKTSKDGLTYWCKECIKGNVRRHRESPGYRKKQLVWNNKWRFREENRSKVLDIRKKSQKKIYEGLKKAGFVTGEIRNAVLARDKYTCLCCEGIEQLTIDHIKPIALGGETVMDNLQTLCRSCNAKKQQDVLDFRISY